MAAERMEDFCGGPFWDPNLTWNTTDPELTPCFEKTILAWIPCAFLWIFTPLQIYYFHTSQQRNIPWTVLNIFKILGVVLLCLLQLVELGYGIHQQNDDYEVFLVDYVSPGIRLASFVLILVFIIASRKYGIQSSGIQFVFWFLLVLLGIPAYRTLITMATNSDSSLEMVPFVTYMIYYPMVVFEFLLNCWADAKPQYDKVAVKSERPCPEASSSFLNQMVFYWFDSLIWRGWKNPLEKKDLWDLNSEDKSSSVVPIFDENWNKAVNKIQDSIPTPHPNATYEKDEKDEANVEFYPGKKEVKKEYASVMSTLWRSFGATFMMGSLLKLIQDLLTFVSPQILKLLIAFVEGKEEMWKGYFYSLILLVTAIIQTLFLAQYFHRMYLVGMRVRSSLISAIYRKSLRTSSAARKESTVGEIVNLMSVDAQRIMDLLAYINMIWSAPLQIGLSLYFLWDILGPSVLAGLAVMIILIPINAVVANKVKKLQIEQMKYKDERVKLMNEVLNGIKVLKLYAWEPAFQEQVMEIRNKEIRVLKSTAYLSAAISFVWTCAPFLVAIMSFTTFVLVSEENVLDAKVAFVSLALFNILRFPLSMLPMMITSTIQATVSVKRINKYLNAEELNPDSVSHHTGDTDQIVIEDATFAWNEEDVPVLRDVTIHVKKNNLVAVVGTVGTGKSTLLSAILGELDRREGRVNTQGSIAYVAQQAWIQNATLKENITFGKPDNDATYNSVVDACALRPDFDILPAGDNTEIGEKGINLSGGQKQRVSLARAVYNDADIYLLDDPLSAVDSHVGKHIFEKVIGPKGLLKGKTRVLVTHGITYLPQVDHIVVLKDGYISEEGTYKQLLANKGAFSDFLLHHISQQEESGDVAELEEIKQELAKTIGNEEFQRQLSRQRSRLSESRSDDSTSIDGHHTKHEGTPEKMLRRTSSIISKIGDKDGVPQKGEKLIEVEKSETGSVKGAVYIYYLKAVGIVMSVLTLLLHVVYQGFSIGSNLWLSVWSNEPAINGVQDVSKRDMYLGVYGALGIGQAISSLIASLLLYYGILNAAKQLHDVMLFNVMRNPMGFFDVTPMGRIINRFNKDIDVLDNIMPMNLRGWMFCTLGVVATIVVISYSTPIFLSIILPVGIVYYLVQRVYVATSRQLKRLESVSRSPIYSHFNETITGAATIRAFGEVERFTKESENKVDENQICYYPSIVSNRWLAVRLETVGNLLIFFASLFAVLGRDTLNPGLVGLSISYALQITQTLNWVVRMTSDVETNIVAVERIKEYGETPQEAAWEVPDHKAPKGWPAKGEVTFDKYATRYRDGLDLVLRGISCDIKGGEKVGIVGRTGAGKSSLTLALFRLIEAASGRILIDGEEIEKLGLHELRGQLTIIPQDPVLFSGTLRMNLDPVKLYNDQLIWEALEHAHLMVFVKSLTTGLEHPISEGGENLSVGQRQLVCLARALLRKTKVLVLDEATAAVDLETDDLIQKTIRTEFKECTVLTIAHRLNTIMDSSRVMVLDKGEIVEFNTPSALLKNKKSVFYSMAKDAGLV